MISTPQKTLLSHLAGCGDLNVFTDLEPDDVLAINLLHNSNVIEKRGNQINYIVGEGSAETKTQRMMRYMANLNKRFPAREGPADSHELFAGHSSDKSYEFDGNEFLPRSFLVDSLGLTESDPVYSWYDEDEHTSVCDYPFSASRLFPKECVSYMKEFTKLHESTNLYIVMKPPRELMELWKCGAVDNSEKNLVLYGSFNLRCIMGEYTHEEILAFLKSFKACYIYESFYVTNTNSFHDDKVEDLYPMDLKRTIHWWNKSILDDCVESVKSKVPEWNGKDDIDIESLEMCEKDKEYVKRNLKVVLDIGRHPMQVVNADCGMIASLLFENMDTLPIKDVELSFNEFGYTQFRETTGSNIKMFVVDKASGEADMFRDEQSRIFRKYLLEAET